MRVTASEDSTYTDTPSLPSTPEILPQAELPVPPNHFTSGLWVPSELSSQSQPTNFNRPPLAADLTVDQLFAQIRSGVDLDQLAFREGNITYWNLQNINRNTNTRPIVNLLDDPRIRAALQWAIIRDHELWTGEICTLEQNVPRENDTRVRVTPKFPLRADQAPQNIPGAHPAQAQRVVHWRGTNKNSSTESWTWGQSSSIFTVSWYSL